MEVRWDDLSTRDRRIPVRDSLGRYPVVSGRKSSTSYLQTVRSDVGFVNNPCINTVVTDRYLPFRLVFLDLDRLPSVIQSVTDPTSFRSVFHSRLGGVIYSFYSSRPTGTILGQGHAGLYSGGVVKIEEGGGCLWDKRTVYFFQKGFTKSVLTFPGRDTSLSSD